MAVDPDIRPTPREIPRWIAYPALFAIAIMCIYGGIWLGSVGVASNMMLASHNNTPVENWVLTLIAISIALSMYASRVYTNHAFRCALDSFVLVTVLVAVLFIFGAWGLYGLVAVLVIWYLVLLRRHRTVQTGTSAPDE